MQKTRALRPDGGRIVRGILALVLSQGHQTPVYSFANWIMRSQGKLGSWALSP